MHFQVKHSSFLRFETLVSPCLLYHIARAKVTLTIIEVSASHIQSGRSLLARKRTPDFPAFSVVSVPIKLFHLPEEMRGKLNELMAARSKA